MPANSKFKSVFYVGSTHLVADIEGGGGDRYVKRSLDAAISDAKNRCENSGETQIVVKVVAVVRRKQPPVTVERV